MKHVHAILATCLVASGFTFAAPPPKKPAAAPARREPPSFKVADKNNDGRVGPDEFAVADPAQGAFGKWDKDNNGFLSPGEYSNYLAANRGPGGPRR